MKRTSAVLDIAYDKVTMLKKPVKLELTSSGHYCVNLRDDSEPDEREILTVTENMTTKEKRLYGSSVETTAFGRPQLADCKYYWPVHVFNDDESNTILKNTVKKTL